MTKHHQHHENFFFFRHPLSGGIPELTALRDGLLPDIAQALTERKVSPKSISVHINGSEVLTCVGYTNDTAHDVTFFVEPIGNISDPEPVLSDALATVAEKHETLCHDILTIPGVAGLCAVLMVKG